MKQAYIYTAAGKAKQVPIFDNATSALKAFAKQLRDKKGHKVFVIRWREVHEAELLPARGGHTRHALMGGIRLRVSHWYDTREAAKRVLVAELKERLRRQRTEMRTAERELKKASR
jgi:hypothetical protein